MPGTRRTRATASPVADGDVDSSPPASTNKAPPAKRARRSTSQDVKPKIKPDPEDEDDDQGEMGDTRFRVRSSASVAAREATFPPEMVQTPLAKLYDTLRDLSTVKVEEDAKPNKDGVVVYWSRCGPFPLTLHNLSCADLLYSNKDLRLDDNTALSYASAVAQDMHLPLVVLHIFSIGDYKSHDRSPRRIDFQLRQLAYLKEQLAALDIPLYTLTHSGNRKDVPRVVCDLLEEWGATGLYANLEYEVDELRRDTEILERTKRARETGEGWKGQVELFKDFCIVAPGEILTKVRAPSREHDARSCSTQTVPDHSERARAAREAVLGLLAIPALLARSDQLASRRLHAQAEWARHRQPLVDALAPRPRLAVLAPNPRVNPGI